MDGGDETVAKADSELASSHLDNSRALPATLAEGVKVGVEAESELADYKLCSSPVLIKVKSEG